MTDTIEKRVGDTEAMLEGLPETLNLRLDRYDSALRDHNARFDEMAGRLNLIDRQIGLLTRDLRDMRGGVMRQLKSQDAELAAINTKLDQQGARLTAIESRLDQQDTRLTAIEAMLGEILRRLPQP